MSNQDQYLSWLSNEALFRAINHVISKYSNALNEQNLKQFTKNTIDPFALLFNSLLSNKSPEEWIIEESSRQLQKSLENAIGEFHQIILGSCNDWEDLGIGNDSYVDLMKKDGSVYAEIKNKYNTMNSSSTESVFNKLKKIVEINPNTTAYLVQIIRKNEKPYNQTWKLKGNNESEEA